MSKRIPMPYGIGVSPFLGFGYIQKLDDPERFIRGVIVRKSDYSMQLYHNGFTTHFVASVDILDHHTLSFVYWGLDQPGFSYTFRF